jgi:alpha-L-rhamnosidase
MLLPVEEVETWTPAFLRSEDLGSSWDIIYPPDPASHSGTSSARIIQPSIVGLSDGRLMAYMRSQEQFIYCTYSEDRGRSWSPPKPTDLPNNNSGIDMVRLQSGNLLLVYNPTNLSTNRNVLHPGLPAEEMPGFDTWGPRTPLSISVSSDDGQTWTDPYNLETGKGAYSYPAVIQAEDGTIHITYTYQREAIKHVQIHEEEIVRPKK